MQIVLDILSGPEGRLSGTAACRPGRSLPFSGNLELLARVEQLTSEGQADDVSRDPENPHRPDPSRRDADERTLP
jgi:hypothetical protein